MIQDQSVVNIQPFLFAQINTSVIERNHAAGQGGEIYAEGSACLKIRIKAVFIWAKRKGWTFTTN